MWDKMMRQCMFKAGFLALECSPGFFYHPSLGVECTVYVEDFVLIAPPAVEAKVWKILDEVITFKEPPVEVTRYLGLRTLLGYLPLALMIDSTRLRLFRANWPRTPPHA